MCKDELIKASVKEKIAKIVFTYSPENKVDDAVSLGAHDKFYCLVLNNETKTLVFTINLEKYDSSLYNMTHKVKELLNLVNELGKRNANQRLSEIRELFVKEAPAAKDLQVAIDWSFLSHTGFSSLPGTERERLIIELYNSYATRVLRSVGYGGMKKGNLFI